MLPSDDDDEVDAKEYSEEVKERIKEIYDEV